MFTSLGDDTDETILTELPPRITPPLVAAALIRARRFAEAIAYLSASDRAETISAQRLLLLAYRHQGRHNDARALEQRFLSPDLAQQATSQVGSASDFFTRYGVLGSLTAMRWVEESSRKNLQLGWEDWRELLPASPPERGRVSGGIRARAR
jgi:hypothetical protein